MPSIDFQNLGMVFVGLIVISQWIWAWQKNRREEARSVEPRHTPPIHEKYATREEVHGIESEIKERIDKLCNRMDRDEHAAAGSRKRIYDQISELGRELSAIKTKSDITSQQLGQMGTKLDNLYAKLCNQ